ncbi:hypothetical protein SH668x_001375 [Planctomicrobium sp. SH668]|uniref:hypothetical protein n=1 Tax=Planctomicrobium sp. SH668 TaxID=3448126 RepID=UPI003F5BFBE7
MALLIAISFCVVLIVAWWYSTRPPRQDFLVPLEMIHSPGGFEDGVLGETLRVESPDDPASDAAVGSDEDSGAGAEGEHSVSQNLASFVANVGVGLTQVDQVIAMSGQGPSRPGSAYGTGGRPLGSGNGDGGFPAEQRWFIRFADEVSLTEYRKQLDFFGIELGALLPDGQLVYISRFTQPNVEKRITKSGRDEKRLYLTWQGEGRKSADVQLFSDAGVNASRAVLFHFYPPEVEQKLLSKEIAFANRLPSEIRRTYFSVSKEGDRYDFVVDRQTYLR